MTHPYNELPERAFWRPSVSERAPFNICDLWHPRFAIEKDAPIATLGSCFAQHISRALLQAGYSWLDAEPAPPGFPAELMAKFQYGIFSARVGNIYTVALLRQWVRWAFEIDAPPAEMWCDGGRFFDPFRPQIEPNGFASEVEAFAMRLATIRALRTMFEKCGIFVFTLGLTEAWVNAANGSVYPMCPGTAAGHYIPGLHQFKNYTYTEIYSDLCDAIRIMREYNPGLKILLTVSPVPLTATASEDHVLVATTYSKSTLRAVAGAAAANLPDVDYFPSYEIISGFPSKGMFYDANLRTVSREGVAHVMKIFLEQLGEAPSTGHDRASCDDQKNPSEEGRPRDVPANGTVPEGINAVDTVCEEMILDVYRR